jgi:outer membrane receptor protein involved in Fe transport
MFKPMPSTTLYASYVEAFDGGGTVGTTFANAGAQLNPVKSKQYEIGAKTDQGIWTGTAALFRIERGAEYTNSQNVLVQDGLSIYQGASWPAPRASAPNGKWAAARCIWTATTTRARPTTATAWPARPASS